MDVIVNFEKRCTVNGPGSTRIDFNRDLYGAVEAFAAASEALLIIKPYQEPRRYNFNLFGFNGQQLKEIIDNFDSFEYEIYVQN